MHMIGHQYIRVNVAGPFEREFVQVLQIACAIDVAEEARLAVVVALHHVLGYSGQIDSWLPGDRSLPVCAREAEVLGCGKRSVDAVAWCKNSSPTPDPPDPGLCLSLFTE